MPTERSGGALVFRVDCHRKVAGNGWDEPCKSRGLRTVLWAAGGEIPPADPARSAIDALLGSPCMVVEQTADGVTHRESRNPDGVWCGPSGARRKGLSAVLSTEGVDPWNFAVRRGRLIRNPWAMSPVISFDLGVDDFQPEEGRYRITAGQSMGEIFGLPDGWPEA